MVYIQGLFKHLLQKGNCSVMMQHDNKPGLEKNPVQWSGQVDFQAGQVTFKAYIVCTTSDKQISRTFQGFFKDKLQFSRTKIYLINRHSLTPFDHPIG